MTKEQRDKIFKVLVEDRNRYARECDRRTAKEDGKITGADYMLQRFLDVLNNTEVESQEREGEMAALDKPEACADCKCGECRGCCTSEGKGGKE